MNIYYFLVKRILTDIFLLLRGLKDRLELGEIILQFQFQLYLIRNHLSLSLDSCTEAAQAYNSLLFSRQKRIKSVWFSFGLLCLLHIPFILFLKQKNVYYLWGFMICNYHESCALCGCNLQKTLFALCFQSRQKHNQDSRLQLYPCLEILQLMDGICQRVLLRHTFDHNSKKTMKNMGAPYFS